MSDDDSRIGHSIQLREALPLETEASLYGQEGRPAGGAAAGPRIDDTDPSHPIRQTLDASIP